MCQCGSILGPHWKGCVRGWPITKAITTFSTCDNAPEGSALCEISIPKGSTPLSRIPRTLWNSVLKVLICFLYLLSLFVSLIYFPYLFSLFEFLICFPYLFPLSICLICFPYLNSLLVFLICFPYFFSLFVFLICVPYLFSLLVFLIYCPYLLSLSVFLIFFRPFFFHEQRDFLNCFLIWFPIFFGNMEALLIILQANENYKYAKK